MRYEIQNSTYIQHFKKQYVRWTHSSFLIK